jgi:hypothetical protein
VSTELAAAASRTVVQTAAGGFPVGAGHSGCDALERGPGRLGLSCFPAHGFSGCTGDELPAHLAKRIKKPQAPSPSAGDSLGISGGKRVPSCHCLKTPGTTLEPCAHSAARRTEHGRKYVSQGS